MEQYKKEFIEYTAMESDIILFFFGCMETDNAVHSGNSVYDSDSICHYAGIRFADRHSADGNESKRTCTEKSTVFRFRVGDQLSAFTSADDYDHTDDTGCQADLR